jgi:hypothetical protein
MGRKGTRGDHDTIYVLFCSTSFHAMLSSFSSVYIAGKHIYEIIVGLVQDGRTNRSTIQTTREAY